MFFLYLDFRPCERRYLMPKTRAKNRPDFHPVFWLNGETFAEVYKFVLCRNVGHFCFIAPGCIGHDFCKHKQTNIMLLCYLPVTAIWFCQAGFLSSELHHVKNWRKLMMILWLIIKHRDMLLLDYVVAFAAPFTVGTFLHVLYPCFAQKDNG